MLNTILSNPLPFAFLTIILSYLVFSNVFDTNCVRPAKKNEAKGSNGDIVVSDKKITIFRDKYYFFFMRLLYRLPKTIEINFEEIIFIEFQYPLNNGMDGFIMFVIAGNNVPEATSSSRYRAYSFPNAVSFNKAQEKQFKHIETYIKDKLE